MPNLDLTLLTPAGQRPAAIVSPYAGTTRDVLESALDIFGYPIVLRSIFIAYLITTHFNVTFGLYDYGQCMLSDSVKRTIWVMLMLQKFNTWASMLYLL